MIKTREELIAYRETCLHALNSQKCRILVCAGTGCVAGGSLDIYDKLVELCRAKSLDTQVELEKHVDHEGIGIKKSGCHGFCEMGPLVKVEPYGYLYTKVKVDDCDEIVEQTVLNAEPVERLFYKDQEGVTYKKQFDIPFYKKQSRTVLDECGQIDANSIDEYIAFGGYSAMEKALFDMTSEKICEDIEFSKLRGRGGGGFPAGVKWKQVLSQKETERYVVCNGDEGDPGAFMDRSIMEGNPHRMLEGMIIAGIATKAKEGYIYVRDEYPLAVARLKNAIAQAKALGILGEKILGSAFSFDIHVNRGAGAFVCGEGSALTSSIEGKRGMPRIKRHRTVSRGLFEKPTVLNNVETYANVPFIISKGVDWYRSIGTETSPGTKAFAITGNINNTGLIEVPMGTTLREIIFNIGGGIKGGKKFKAVQIGGPSGGCLTEEHLDMPLDFDSLTKAGAMIGSGGLVVMDEDTCMVEVARFFMNFTQNESCGKCIPCREGTKRMLEILQNIVDGKGKDGDIELLLELAETVSANALCGLGKSAPNPVVSTIKYFRDEYEAHIYEKRCPTGKCQKLKRFVIDPALCKGCSLCARNCPVDAISGQIKSPFTIDQDKCIKCGACMSGCKFKAIKEEF